MELVINVVVTTEH